ncbi:MAG: bifunctional riboflavin kinase/FAD synthetase [Rhodobacteraceae bacterium]|nr:bifunctional riboflavin kinase/FAD synthetase [Paracoccaceae bacterium]
MRIFRSWEGLPDDARGASVALGNFDGVHLGHQAVIGQARAEAARQGVPPGVVTFEPHPRQFFAPDAPPFRLMNAEARGNRLAKLGVGVLFELPFDSRLAEMTPRRFAAEVLAGGLGIRHVVVGSDFRFGKGRSGTAEELRALGAELGFGVTVARLVAEGGAEVSSTAIRRALSEGRPRDAARMLGHWHRIEGEVQHGDKRGRTIGYPTANMSIEGLHPPKFGIYAVRADVLTGPHAGSFLGAASVGVRPMFGDNRPNLETFLFDFSGDLYGAHMSVALVDYLRPEATFPNLEALVAQMDADCARARAILAEV